MKYLKYLSYVIRHKWFVFLEGLKLGVPLWRLIKHDWHKFLPDEFFPYVNFFYGEKRQIRDETGYYKPYDTGNRAFDMAWLRHQNRADHHWQWWILTEDDTGVPKPMPMSLFAMREMVADWRGAGRAQGTPDTLAWYEKNKDKIILHPASRFHVEWLIGYTVDWKLNHEQ